MSEIIKYLANQPDINQQHCHGCGFFTISDKQNNRYKFRYVSSVEYVKELVEAIRVDDQAKIDLYKKHIVGTTPTSTVNTRGFKAPIVSSRPKRFFR